MKKILFFIESLSGGGAEKVLTDLVTNLDKHKYNVTVCSLVDVGVYNEYLSSICNYKTILPNRDKLNQLQKIFYNLRYNIIRKLPASWLYKMFFKEAYDTEIAFTEGFVTKIIGASSNKTSNKIAWVHIDLFSNHWTKKEYKSLESEIKFYKNFNHIVSVAQSVQDAFSKRFGIVDNLSVKYNPIDRNNIIAKSKEPLDITTQKKGIRLVSVGRLEHQKGYDRLLEVAKRLSDDNFDFELWIVGKGSKQKALEDIIAKYKLRDIVTLHGFQTNPYKFIRASDAFICSSRSEGFSTVVTEALILGKPVIATNCSGMTELLGDNQYGLITDNNTDALYQGLKTFLKDKTLKDYYSKKSKERSTDFDIRSIMKNIEDIL